MPNDAHTTRPWRIHELTHGFQVLDVWALPTPGGPADFTRLITLFSSFDAQRSSPVVHALFAARWALGRLLNLDGESGSPVGGLRDTLPADLRDSSPLELGRGRFTPLYATDDEAAWEIVNRTVHGILHLGWVADGSGGFRGQLAVLVKPNGPLGAAYLAAIAPFRHLVVYPTMLGDLERRWRVQSTVRQVDVPDDVRALTALPRIDYADAFLVDTSAAPDWTAERWARAMLEQAPAATRAKLLSGWTALGLKDGAAGSILEWDVRHNSADTVLLGRDSRVGMPAELVFTLRPEGLLFATFVHHRTSATRPTWAAIEPTHVRIVLTLLEAVGRRAAEVRESAGAG
ncbi:DUF2867 domain-containing protein [Mycobacterium sp. URHB0044]|uniref:DUF2867 domain-containing protein n=1 Tax=Mycobacterium sp. URHB0044 TaxID=1380386 RepID=UPI000AAA8C59